MPTQEAKAHHVGEWASLRNTSPEIAEAIFEVAKYDEKLAEKFGRKAATKCCLKPLRRRIKIRYFGANKPSNVKMSDLFSPPARGEPLLFCRAVQHVIELIKRTEAVCVYRASCQFQRDALRR